MALTNGLAAVADALDAVIDRIGRVTGWCSLAIVVVMAWNVLLRYFFRTGSVAMQELEWHLMAPICMLGLSYAILKDGHVQVDILLRPFPERLQNVIRSSRPCWWCLVIAILLKLSIPYVMQSYNIGEKSPDPGRAHSSLDREGDAAGGLCAAARAEHSPPCCARSSPSSIRPRTSEAPRTRSDMPFTELLAILCIVSFFVLLAIGLPVALTLAVSGLFWGYLGFGAGLFDLLPARIYGVTANYTLIAIPLFVFMGCMLEKSKIADDLMDVIGHLAGGLRGGMGIGIILVGVLMGATTGIVGATIVTLGLITLPALMRRGYHLPTACGTICASGTLGQIIPPSTILILLADILGQSVGTLFAAALIPGLVLSAIFCVYLLLLGIVRPTMVPPVALAEREAMSGRDLFKAALRIGLPPISLVLAVLGSIIGGIAAPTEAASMGVLGSIVVVALAGRFSFAVLRETALATTRITAGMMFIFICAQVFALAFRGLHGEQLVGICSTSCRAASTAC